jgi:PilZ domain-containing protein
MRRVSSAILTEMGFPVVEGIVRYARSFYQLVGNRRKVVRAPIAGTILVTTKGYVIDMSHTCACVDISQRGIGIDSPEPLALDAFVQVHSDEYAPRRVARVRFCNQLGDVYRVGLQFVARPQSTNGESAPRS